MKTIWKVVFIALGLLVFASGCVIDDGTIAMLVEFLGAIILLIGLLPIIDKEAIKTLVEDKKE